MSLVRGNLKSKIIKSKIKKGHLRCVETALISKNDE